LNTRSEDQLAVLWSRIFKANARTYPSERDAVLVKLADGRGVHTRLFSLNVPGADDVDPNAMAAGRIGTVVESIVSRDVLCGI
jgi:hypothetical protein